MAFLQHPTRRGTRRGLRWVWLSVAVTALGACRGEGGATPNPASAAQPIAASTKAAARVASLRAQFRVGPANQQKPVIGASVASGFVISASGRVRAVLPGGAKHSVARSASVELPRLANGATRIQDDESRVAISFALEGAGAAPIRVTGGDALYAGALGGADLVERVDAKGTEDYVAFETRPALQELDYTVDVSRVAGLRLVDDVLEFIGRSGTPALRVDPPYIVDAEGRARAASIAVDGCAVDSSPRAPWGRAPTAPGAATCSVRVTWKNVAYPALVDPAWSTTGSMAYQRTGHTATLLESGKVLVAGGHKASGGFTDLASAELYDPASGTFAASGPMTAARVDATATRLPSGKVLIAGGFQGTSSGSADLYDETLGAFTATGPMAESRQWATATLLPSGKVLIAGGANGTVLGEAELYDEAAGAFTATGSMTAMRQLHTATLLPSGKVLIAGGVDNNGNSLPGAELYDPASGVFTATGSMTTGRSDHTATLLPSGKVLITGGTDEQNGFGYALASAELYTPASATFAATGSMTAARSGHTATLLGSGPAAEVLIAGGSGSSTELYNPPYGLCAPDLSMTTERRDPTATRLNSGWVLVVGGWGASGTLASAELYHGTQADGARCGTSFDCTSGVCLDGVCCSGPCSGTCDANGKCWSTDGQQCSTDASCASGYCVDGVCCDSSCDFLCEACNTPGALGQCKLVTGVPCGSAGACQGTCQGSATSVTCAYPGSTTSCGSPATCSGDTLQLPGHCDGAGACQLPSARNCAPYACDAMNGSCRTGCNTSSDCAAGTHCESGSCVPATDGGTDAGTSGASGSGGTGGQATGGGGGAQPNSGSGGNNMDAGTDDAGVAGNDAGGPAATSANRGGCGCHTAQTGQSPAGLLGVFMLLALGVTRRRRASVV